MVYPLDYGFVPGTRGGDGQELDIFVGTARERSVVGLVETVDLVKNDTEIKLLFQMTPSEIAIVHDFLNASGMRTHLVQRWPPAQ
jgi:inorganic pyrophosphatase